MRRINKVILLLFISVILISCGKKSYVVFDYNCNGSDYYKCELKGDKLNCNVSTPVCGEYKFKGWYRANEFETPIDLSSNFNKNEIIYARWEKGNGRIEPNSSEEPTSTIVTPGIIDIPSSSKEEPSSSETPSSSQQPINPPTPVDPPKPEETYTISFNLNGGTGGQTTPISGVKYNNNLPSINQNKPTKPGYTFQGWYDNQNGGIQYYNSSNSPVRKYDKRSNTTLYAQWKINTLSIQYNGNGGTWANPSKDTYAVNSSNTVIVKSTNKVYQQQLNYGVKLESSGLVDYSGSWFKWARSGYTVESKKEYIIGSTVLDQNKAYSAVELSRYGGCDLSKTNCIITVKVNWKKQEKLAINSISVSDVVVTINVTGGVNKIAGYYFSSIQKIPDKNGYDWINTNKSTFKVVKFPGTYYVYLKDDKGNITGGNKVVVNGFYDTTMLHIGKRVLNNKSIGDFVKSENYYNSVLDFTKEMASYNKKYGLRTRESVVIGAMFFTGKLQSWGMTMPYSGSNGAISKEVWGISDYWGSGTHSFLACNPFVIWAFKNAGLNIYGNRDKIKYEITKQSAQLPNGTEYFKIVYPPYDDYSKVYIAYYLIGALGSTSDYGDNIIPRKHGQSGDVLQSYAGSGHDMLIVDKYDDNNDGLSDGYIVLQSRDIGLCYEKVKYGETVVYDMSNVYSNTGGFAAYLNGWQNYYIPESDYPSYLK